jgi:S-DNA-T family DNA segregation ATPase FtsK/SpoIIIE
VTIRSRSAPTSGAAGYLTLMFAAIVVGLIPRMAKTFAVRLILLAAALDPL